MIRSWQPQRGEVVLVRFPFLDAEGSPQARLRPAVILSGDAIHRHTADVLLAAISSRPTSAPLPTDYQIPAGTPEHEAAGLKVTSWIKLSNLANVPRSAIARRLGRLIAASLQQVDERLRLALELD